jgi:hypothetical protein
MKNSINHKHLSYCQEKIHLLDLFETQIRQGEGKVLLALLLDDMKLFSNQKIDQQELLMACLENWWNLNKYLASYLMARLLPQAAKLTDNHSLCNAIEIYLTSGKDPAVTESIQLLLKEDLAPFYKKKYRQYLEHYL